MNAALFDRWVIDAETLGASKRMQTVMSETMVPYSVDEQTIAYPTRGS